MAALPAKHRFSAAEYRRMGEAGIFDEDDRVELIEGEVVEMAPIGPEHAASVIRLNRLFSRLFGDEALVSPQNPLILDPYSEPQPDFAILEPRVDLYASRLPTPDDALLVVEVADSSVLYDRRRKVPLYARAGVRELWLVSLPEQVVTVYRDPTPTGHRKIEEFHRGGRIAPLAFPDREVAVADLLG